MVIIATREGQLANRMWHASYFMANAREHGYRLVYPFFDDYYPYFSENLRTTNFPVQFWCTQKRSAQTLFQKILEKTVRCLLKLGITRFPFVEIIPSAKYSEKSFDLNDESFVKKARSKLILIEGWQFGDFTNHKKYRQLLVDTWAPAKRYQENVTAYHKMYRKDHDCLIGVHLRRGDYKNFEDGRWYYSVEQYRDKMNEIANLKMFSGKKIAFVICTNEKELSLEGTDKFSVFNDDRHFIEDLYLLAKCDYIIGPPSTYSMWASFYGNVPLLMLTDISKTIDDDLFARNAKVYQ